MWIFFRVETEWVRNTSSNVYGDDTQNDILLDNYNSSGSNLLGDFDSGRDDSD